MSNLEIKDMKEIALGMLREALSEERTRKNIIVELDGKLPSALSAALLIEALGYKHNDIKNVVVKVDGSLPIESQIKEALKLLLK